MTFSTRTLAPLVLAFCITLLAIGSLFKQQIQGEQGELYRASHAATRLSLDLKAQTTAYELVLNEYYATVIDTERYRQKATAIRQAIEHTLDGLKNLGNQDYTLAEKELGNLLREIDQQRPPLENALQENQRDWEKAREMLFKINITSAQVIELASKTALSATEKADLLAKQQQTQQYQLNLALIAIALLAAAQTFINLRRQVAR